MSLVDWLPQSTAEILIHGTRDLGILNIKTGQLDVYTTSGVPGEFRHPVWVNNPPGIVYFTVDEDGFDLWLTQTGGIHQLQASL